MTGNIVDESDKDEAGNAKVVGSFTVDTDGKVTLTFTDEKFIGTDEKGGLTFTGTFKAAVTASAEPHRLTAGRSTSVQRLAAVFAEAKSAV